MVLSDNRCVPEHRHRHGLRKRIRSRWDRVRAVLAHTSAAKTSSPLRPQHERPGTQDHTRTSSFSAPPTPTHRLHQAREVHRRSAHRDKRLHEERRSGRRWASEEQLTWLQRGSSSCTNSASILVRSTVARATIAPAGRMLIAGGAEPDRSRRRTDLIANLVRRFRRSFDDPSTGFGRRPHRVDDGNAGDRPEPERRIQIQACRVQRPERQFG